MSPCGTLPRPVAPCRVSLSLPALLADGMPPQRPPAGATVVGEADEAGTSRGRMTAYAFFVQVAYSKNFFHKNLSYL